ERPPRRRLDRTAVEHDGEAPLLLGYRRGRIESPPQLRSHRAARRFDRIDRLSGKNVLEQIAHAANMWAAEHDHATALFSRSLAPPRSPIDLRAARFPG